MTDSPRLYGVGQRPEVNRLVATAAGVAVVGFVASAMAITSSVIRPVVAALFAAILLLVAFKSPRITVIATLIFLPFLELVRRVLIPAAGWTSNDPLLTVAPLVALVLVARFWLSGRSMFDDRLSKLLGGVLAITLIEVLNPKGGGIVASLVGLLYVGAPLLWFFIGQELVDVVFLRRVFRLIVVLAVAIAAYGLNQTWFGFPSWDDQWLTVTGGYSALHVGSQLRSFGTFASASEYAAYLASALVVSFALVTRGRWLPALAIPPLAIAMFLEASRGFVVLCFLALLVVLGLRSGGGRLATVIVIGGFFAGIAGVSALAPRSSSNDLVSHQLGGLTDPFNSDQSTLILHWNLVVDGFRSSLSQPLGLGTSATNLAGRDLGAQTNASSEVDLSDEFIGLGLAGGLLFAAVVVVTFKRVAQLCLHTRNALDLAIAGVLVACLGQWVNGGYYATSAIVFLLIGSANRRWRETFPQRVGTRALAAQPA